LAGAALPADAQESITLRADLIFYGDNTEFRNPFREGETIFGVVVRAAAVLAVGTRAEITAGVLTNQRFGGDEAFELVRPVVALRIRGDRSAFIFGTLPSSQPGVPAGPDRTGPHKLLPPLQRETHTFDRPNEAGFQWDLSTTRARQTAWLNWQRVATTTHRERFDTGVNGELRLGGPFSLPYQLHVVHEGGQVSAAGPVTDSVAGAVGVAFTHGSAATRLMTLESYLLVSSDTPDRERPELDRDGRAFFGRAAAETERWRGHILFWRGRQFITREGDQNYLSLRRNGSGYGGIRDYSEAGLTRTFTPAPGLLLEASGRLHRVERNYEYSYRIVATTRLEWILR
jgi:hypothetical protein